ncbi:copper chaperone PCu(A)C [Qipengyuania sphaerica]|uniref:copper chaperone PCu(A)C n=1 Tax=Qipengyuania sphaerica TaxID=2867243 RepID=UPI001C8850D3|nr:copper chaperone PCu(A)C [Qipengyuania sphaerica]MBX7540694.1 copper chaperone PCu(A)C [Qipengyuania sphaerica]
MMRKSGFFAACMLAPALLAVSACGDNAPAEEASADAAGIAGIEIANARMVLPPVSGNPAAIYFDLDNKGDRNIAFRSAEVEGAESAVIHGSMMQGDQMVMSEAPPVMVERGGSTKFEPGGLHVMVFGLGGSLAEGGTANVTLIAAGNRRHTFEAKIQSAGDDR